MVDYVILSKKPKLRTSIGNLEIKQECRDTKSVKISLASELSAPFPTAQLQRSQRSDGWYSIRQQLYSVTSYSDHGNKLVKYGS